MGKTLFKINLIAAFLLCSYTNAQLFRTKDRMDNLEGFDNQKFSYGFFLAANNFDYKLVLDPKFGMAGQKNLVQTKSSYSFGAGLIGKVRLNDYFDLRIEPALQFVEREIYFYTGPSSTTKPQDLEDVRMVKSTYVDIPLLIEVHGDRWYNSRPYAAAGVNWMMNLQSNSNSEEDNKQGVFRTTASNFAWSAEIGMQFYFSRFKLTPGFRGTFMINNELVADEAATPPCWSAAMSSAKTRAFMFVLKFE